jgi:RNA polymerase sigma-70 factor, ECF subfamily
MDTKTHVLLQKYIAAWEAANIPALVALLHDEATLAMPPHPWWLRGRAAIAGFFESLLSGSQPGAWRLFAVGANAQPAYLSYRLDSAGNYQAQSVSLLTCVGHQITELTCFLDPALCRRFGFPLSLTTEQVAARQPG